MSLSLSIFLVLPQISLVKYYETIKILMQIFSYFQIPFSQWRGSAQKSYFEVFFKAQKNLIVCKIWSLYDTPFRFFCQSIDTPFLANMWWEYFSFNIWTVFYQSELEFSDLDQKWAKTRPLLLQILELPISIA